MTSFQEICFKYGAVVLAKPSNGICNLSFKLKTFLVALKLDEVKLLFSKIG